MEAVLHEHHCRNCGGIAPGTYCPDCGQETKVALPTARQFLREAAGRFVALDSRLWRTLFGLMARPGYLTGEYLAGRRRRYVRPARLFLFSSIVAFALLKFVAEPELVRVGLGDDAERPVVVHGKTAGGPPAAKADADASDAIFSAGSLKVNVDRDLNLAVVGDSPVSQPLRNRLQAFNHMSADDKRRQVAANVFRYGPYAAFVLLPACAFLLQWLYMLPSRRFPLRPRRFAAHLVFAAHNHAFLFVLVALLALLPNGPIVYAVVGTYASVYLLLSLRRVYAGSWFGILVRSLILALAYVVLFVLVVVSLLMLAVLLG